MQNICDGGDIKHSSDFSYVCDAGNTVQFNELFVMRQNSRNGQLDEGVCNIRHTVHSDKLFVMRRNIVGGTLDGDLSRIGGGIPKNKRKPREKTRATLKKKPKSHMH